MSTSLTALLLSLAGATAGCTINLDGASDHDGDSSTDDGTDNDTDDDDATLPGDPAAATLVIGLAPGITIANGGIGWATVFLNYPAYDCDGVDFYGSAEPVQTDAMFEAFRIDLAEQLDFARWVQLERDTATQLWRITDFGIDTSADESGRPACYFW